MLDNPRTLEYDCNVTAQALIDLVKHHVLGRIFPDVQYLVVICEEDRQRITLSSCISVSSENECSTDYTHLHVKEIYKMMNLEPTNCFFFFLSQQLTANTAPPTHICALHTSKYRIVQDFFLFPCFCRHKRNMEIICIFIFKQIPLYFPVVVFYKHKKFFGCFHS